MQNNPLLSKNNEPFNTIPFSDIKTEHYLPAIKKGIELNEKEIDEIVNNSEKPNFKNTILALEKSGELLDSITTTYFHLFGSESDSEFQKLANEISPMLAKLENDINLNTELFEKVEFVYENHYSDMNADDKKLTEIIYKDFVRNGSKLNEDKKNKLREIDNKLSTLSPKFGNNTLNATNAFELWLEESDLDGLPEVSIEMAKAAAKEKGNENQYLFTLHMPSYFPFMKYSKRRDLREKFMKAMSRKCYGDKYDNSQYVKDIAFLKHQRAQILGYENFADYVLEKRMAENQKNIFNLLDNLYDSSYDLAKNELEDVKKIAKDMDGIEKLEVWDTMYYSEKLKEKLYNFNESELRPYFKAENVIDGIFKVANKLYGLNFEKLNNIQTYHDDINVYQVTGDKNEHIGLLYEDLYPRPGKRSGAWMNELKSQGMNFDGQIERPHVTFTCNFTKSTPTKPALLSYDEVNTVYHEFGHCLHGLLSDCKYKSTGGTSVFWDFVELPSQIMENWLDEKETLSLFAYHYESGDLIPEELVQKIKKSKNFMSASMCLRQLSLGYLDMAWYGKPVEVENIEEFENKTLEKTSLLDRIPGSTISCNFGHIFAGGYSAGYYSYKWAEVLEADAFEKFKEDGIFNKETASSFRKNILSKGNLEHPMRLYEKFRGREPKVDALIKRDGLKELNEA
ncbi:MAG: peptidase M3 [Candidatus Marinimicrobia bacterium]|nr:peptidase M3 [Candidatus Neomarinimicrobiota bacterium]